MKIKWFFSIVSMCLLLSTGGYAQDCNCESNFEWLKKTFEENDAGFQYIIDKKGEQAYAVHNEMFREKIEAAKTLGDCTALLYEWLTFFRSGHIGIENMVFVEPTSSNASTTSSAIVDAKSWETVDVDINEFTIYLNNKKENDFEGIWALRPNYVIAIKKEGNTYIGSIVESAAASWKKGEVKLKIIKEEEKIKSVFYMGDRSARQEENAVELIGANHLQVGNLTLYRQQPNLPVDLAVERYFKMASTWKPYVEEIDSSTILLRIPDFDNSQKQIIDSLIIANKEKILRTKNLIIDVRNNGGGADRCYREIIPFLYTNPIRTMWVEFLSTKLNNQRMLDFANNPEWGFDEEFKKWALESYDKLEKHLGEFVNLHSSDVTIDTLDMVYEFPKNVGIIINEGNASTTEQFLLAAKQSKKVKLFGVTTGGALDISNIHSLESPCKEFKLIYCLTKSKRIPGMAIDDIGIQPDFYIDKSIPQYKWVDFVKEVLNE